MTAEDLGEKRSMPKRNSFRPWQPEQTTLLPALRRECLLDDHQVYVLLNFVDELDLSQDLIPVQAKEPRWLTNKPLEWTGHQ
jgi:hypothetical protein